MDAILGKDYKIESGLAARENDYSLIQTGFTMLV